MGVIDSNQIQILAQVLLAMILGGVIGFDRESADKPAGLRTHMLVAGAGALLVSLSTLIVEASTVDLGGSIIRSDPIRIVEAVITGVSFLGAGTILRRTEKGHVEGLTTAASILMATAVGICVAISETLLAIGVTVMALLVLRGVKYLTGLTDRI